MGHYRSEMGYEDEDKKAALYRDKRYDSTEAEIQRAFEEKGIARVLAEILVDAGDNMIFIGSKFKR